MPIGPSCHMNRELTAPVRNKALQGDEHDNAVLSTRLVLLSRNEADASRTVCLAFRVNNSAVWSAF